VRTMSETALKLTRATIPGASAVMVLGYHEGDR